MHKQFPQLLLIMLAIISMAVFAVGCVAVSQETPQVPAPVSAAPGVGIETTLANLPPAINYFNIVPSTIDPGQSAVLEWDVIGASELTIAPAINSGGSSSISQGSEQVSPAATTTYTLTATNSFGSRVTSSATVTVTGSDGRLVGFDPVSGRNDEIDLQWEQLCLADEYQVQIAKNPNFSIIVLDTGPFPRIDPASRGFSPADPTSPGAYFPAGGQIGVGSPYNSAIGLNGVLEAGHIYYIRYRVTRAATGQIMYSHWSPTYKYTIKSGLPSSTSSYGSQPLYPSDRYTGCPVSKVSFSWTPFKDTFRYRFQLARDAAMTQILAQADTATTAYQYQGSLDYDTSYFWRVMAVEPAPSDWSAVFTLQTETAPVLPSSSTEQQTIPPWAVVIIGIGSALAIAVIILILMTRRHRA